MKHKTYCNIKAKDRIQELELIAFTQMTGEDIADALEAISQALKYEYERLSYGEVDRPKGS